MAPPAPGGKLYIDANPNTTSSKQVLIHAETGSFTLNSGRIGVDNGLAKNSIVVVEGKGDAKVVFNGGKVDAISPKVGIPYVYSALLSSNCKAEFNGGEFEEARIDLEVRLVIALVCPVGKA